MAKKTKTAKTPAAKAKAEEAVKAVKNDTQNTSPAAAEKSAQKTDAKEPAKAVKSKKTEGAVKAAKTADAVKADKAVKEEKAPKAEKTAAKAKTAAAPNEVIKVQFGFDEYEIEAVRKAVEDDFRNKHKGSRFKNVQIYIKPEEKKAYYVVNEKYHESVEL